MNSNAPFVLQCHAVSKTYIDGSSHIEVLQDMNLEVKSAEWVAIIGHSGSGKSTFLHLLAGLDQPTQGTVLLNGHNLQQVNEKTKCVLRNRYLGFVYQFHYLLPEFSALENVSMPLLIRGLMPEFIRDRALHLLTQVGLAHRTEHRLGQLSGGERARVAIARALITEPLCLLLDEPTGNLDPGNAERVLSLIVNLQQSHQTSVVMVTHDQSVASCAQRILHLEKGKLI